MPTLITICRLREKIAGAKAAATAAGDVAECPYSKQKEYWVIVGKKGSLRQSSTDHAKLFVRTGADMHTAEMFQPRDIHKMYGSSRAPVLEPSSEGSTSNPVPKPKKKPESQSAAAKVPCKMGFLQAVVGL